MVQRLREVGCHQAVVGLRSPCSAAEHANPTSAAGIRTLYAIHSDGLSEYAGMWQRDDHILHMGHIGAQGASSVRCALFVGGGRADRWVRAERTKPLPHSRPWAEVLVFNRHTIIISGSERHRDL
jgi:hypothetical protein